MGVSKKCKKECLGCLWGVFGGFMGSLGVTWADIGCPLGVVGVLGGLVGPYRSLNCKILIFAKQKQTL